MGQTLLIHVIPVCHPTVAAAAAADDDDDDDIL